MKLLNPTIPTLIMKTSLVVNMQLENKGGAVHTHLLAPAESCGVWTVCASPLHNSAMVLSIVAIMQMKITVIRDFLLKLYR